MADRIWQVGAVVLLLVTGGLVFYQTNLRNELSFARDKVRTLQNQNRDLQQHLKDANKANSVSSLKKRALEQQLSELQEDHTDVKKSADATQAQLNAKLRSAASETKKAKDQLATCEKQNAALLAEKQKLEQTLSRQAAASRTRAPQPPTSASAATTSASAATAGKDDQQNSEGKQDAVAQRVAENEQQRKEAILNNQAQENKDTPKN